MASKIAIHCQVGLPWWLKGYLQITKSKWVKAMDVGFDRPLPSLTDVNWIIRFSESETIAKNEVLSGALGAHARLSRVKHMFEDRPWLSEDRYYVEHMNEPTNAGILSTKEGRLALNDFTAEYARLLYENFGIKSVGYCLGVGHPEMEHVGELFSKGLPALLKYNGLWALHEYGYPYMDFNGYYCGRYRHTIAELVKRGIKYPKLVITECGIDKLLIGEIGGWQKVNKDPNWYVRSQLAGYDSYLMADDDVICATVFTASAVDPWKSGGYEVTEQVGDELIEYILENENGTDPPDPPDPPVENGDVKFYDKNGLEVSKEAFESIHGVFTISTHEDAKYGVKEIHDSGEPAGMDCQIYVRGGYPDGARTIIQNGGTAYAAIKTAEMQEVSFWQCYAPEDNPGAYSIFVVDKYDAIISEVISGLGWLCETEHRHVQKLVFDEIEEIPTVEYAKGVDVSHWQGPVPWAELKNLGYTFAILRVSGPKKIGSTVDKTVVEKDIMLDQHYAEASAEGFLLGGYHYLVSDVNYQALVCQEAIGDKVFSLPIFCDAEEGDLNKDRILRFCNALDSRLGRVTGLYFNLNGYNNWDIASWAGTRPLWPARPGISSCDIPGWKFWQCGQFTVNGMLLDDNRYNGTHEQLVAEYPPVDPPDPPPNNVEKAKELLRSAMDNIELAEKYAINAEGNIEDALLLLEN